MWVLTAAPTTTRICPGARSSATTSCFSTPLGLVPELRCRRKSSMSKCVGTSPRWCSQLCQVHLQKWSLPLGWMHHGWFYLHQCSWHRWLVHRVHWILLPVHTVLDRVKMVLVFLLQTGLAFRTMNMLPYLLQRMHRLLGSLQPCSAPCLCRCSLDLLGDLTKCVSCEQRIWAWHHWSPSAFSSLQMLQGQG